MRSNEKFSFETMLAVSLRSQEREAILVGLSLVASQEDRSQINRTRS